MEHILCFTEETQAEKVLAVIEEKIGCERSWLTKPEQDGSCSVHLATHGLLTEQQEEVLMALSAEMMILDLNEEEA